MKKIKKKLFELITWILVVCATVFLYITIAGNNAFPNKWKLPFIAFLALLVSLSGIFSIVTKKFGRYVIGIVNIFIAICLFGLTLFLPGVKKQAQTLFKETTEEEAIINVYRLKGNDKDLSEGTFILQKALDQQNQEYALDQLKDFLDQDELSIIETKDILSGVDALYNKEGDFLLLNDVYVDAIEDVSTYRDFSDETEVVYGVVNQIVKEEKTFVHEDITTTPFTVYVAGCDTRSGRLTIYGRTDVNLLLSINPNTKQILIVGIPRDAYIPNPALNYGEDKLTHLGNHGIDNTMKGVSEYFDIPIDHYGEVIFETFKSIIDALGGIDVDNPYYFNTINGNGGGNREFPEGVIHMDGETALSYCRERWNLPNGAYGRNEHQTYVLKAIMNKLLSREILDRYVFVWDALKGQFMSDFDIEDIFDLAAMQFDDEGKWEIITYHLGGKGDMCGTASMGFDRKLYVVHLFDSQVQFVKQQIDLLKKDELIQQEVLPQNDETTYIPN